MRPQTPSAPLQWDIFCRVIDNFGDIGVCWRLSADLAARGQQVRLWVDDASALAWLAPQGVDAVNMGLQRTQGNRPDAGVGVVVGQRDPVIQRAVRLRVHRGQHFRFALEAVCLELGNRLRRLAQYVAVGRQDKVDFMGVAGLAEPVQRVEVGGHFAVGRVDDGGASVEDVVA